MSDGELDLNFLPQWLPDETLFSLSSRYNSLTGKPAGKHTSRMLFGSSRSGYQHDFPSGIKYFVKTTEGKYGHSRDIITTRTLLAYYVPFKKHEIIQSAIATMKSPRIGGLKFQLGILTSGTRANNPLRCCIDCIAEDKQYFQVAYWHLAHQFPGVLICHRHLSPLYTSNIKSTGVERFSYFLPSSNRKDLDELLLHDPSTTDLLTRITMMTTSFIADVKTSNKLKTIRTTIRKRMRQMNFISDSGRTKVTRASNDFYKFISPLYSISEFQSIPNTTESLGYMIPRLISENAAPTHPLKYFLFLTWLFNSYDKYIETVNTKIVRPHSVSNKGRLKKKDIKQKKIQFLKLIAQGVSSTESSRKMRIEPATGIKWAKEAGIIIKRKPKKLKGPLVADIKTKIEAGIEKSLIAASHKVSISTIARILYSDPDLESTWKQNNFLRKRDSYRRKWHLLRKSYGHLGVKAVRGMSKATYTWLYRHDHIWLKTENSKIDKIKPDRRQTVDWQARDDELAHSIQKALEKILNSQKSKKITLGHLCKHIPDLKRRLSQTKRLPKTKNLLDLSLQKNIPRGKNDTLPIKR